MKNGQLLQISGLKTHFFTETGVVRAVDGVSLSVGRASTVGLVGESGCGKSVTALSVLRLVPSPPGRIVEGSVRFRGRELLDLPEREMRGIRGNNISMIFQEPMTSLNPVFTIGNQIVEAIRLHQKLPVKEANGRVLELLQLVGIPSPQERVRDYPHQLSGGMRQRVMIAMALACRPDLLIADEPTTALDVTIQAQILELLRRLQAELNMSMLLITHDLGVIADAAERVVVMYAGKVVEEAPCRELLHDAKHPYTKALIECLPEAGGKRGELKVIPGRVPDLSDVPPGCAFHPRCGIAVDRCRSEVPEERQVGVHLVACHLA